MELIDFLGKAWGSEVNEEDIAEVTHSDMIKVITEEMMTPFSLSHRMGRVHVVVDVANIVVMIMHEVENGGFYSVSVPL